MRLWTLQRMEVWERLQKTGVHRCDGRRIDPCFRRAYRWLVGQMNERIGPPPRGVTYPVWAWHTSEGQRRAARFRGPGASVLMRIEVPDDQVLLSDHTLWHYVLNDCYLGVTDREANEFRLRSQAAGPDSSRANRPFYSEVEKSWERIFTLRAWRRFYEGAVDNIQATFWELRIEQVQRVWITTKAAAQERNGRRR